MDFMQDCADRIITKPQITTDAHKPYLKAVEEAFGGDANYAVLHKVYGLLRRLIRGTALLPALGAT